MVDKRRRDERNDRVTLEIEANEIAHISGDDFKGRISATLTRGNRPVRWVEIQFFVAGVLAGHPLQTDEDGRVADDISIHSAAKIISIEAQMAGYATRAKKFVTLPRPPEKKKPTPTELIVNPTRIRNQINLFVRVVDAENRGIKAKLRIIDGERVLTLDTDDDGEYQHPAIELQSHEEREIAIYVSGHGDQGFRRTFRGR